MNNESQQLILIFFLGVCIAGLTFGLVSNYSSETYKITVTLDDVEESSVSSSEIIQFSELDSYSKKLVTEKQVIVSTKAEQQKYKQSKLMSANYLSINDQLYRYSVRPTINDDVYSNSILVHPMNILEISLNIGAIPLIGLLLPVVIIKSIGTYIKDPQTIFVIVFVLLLLVPTIQSYVFMTNQFYSGEVSLIGTASEVKDATNYSELSLQQKIVVNSLIQRSTTPKTEQRNHSYKTQLPEGQLQELDAIILADYPSSKNTYYNFVVTPTESTWYHLSSIEITYIFVLYVLTGIIGIKQHLMVKEDMSDETVNFESR